MSNGYVQLLGWGVGNLEWLNDPASKVNRYWRVIEEGSEATAWPWQGQTIVGLWGPQAEPRGALHGTGFSVFGESDTEKFIPFFAKLGTDLDAAKRAALLSLFGVAPGSKMTVTRNEDLLYGDTPAQKRKALYYLMERVPVDRVPFVRGVIQQPVLARHHYANARAKFQPLAKELEALREQLRGIFSQDIATTAGLQKARGILATDVSGVPRSGPRRSESREFPSDGAVVSITASPIVQDLIRDGKGQFSTKVWQDIVRAVNRQVAEAFQAAVVAEMESERGRRPATDRLIEATASPQNIYTG